MNTWRQLKSNWILIVLIAVMLPANYHWWTILAQQRSGPSRADERAVIGSKALPIVARASDGQWRRIAFSETGSAIVYVMSPQCGWCAKNMANVRQLSSSVDGRYAFVGLLTGSGDPTSYAKTNGLTFPVYTDVAESSKDAYKMIGTPQTIVIRDGFVVANWIGAYIGDREREIEALLSVKLPGLLLDAPNPATTTAAGCLGADGTWYSVGRRIKSDTGAQLCQPDGNWSKAR